MSLTPHVVSSLLDDLYDTAPTAWPRFLTHLTDATASDRIFLLVEDPTTIPPYLPPADPHAAIENQPAHLQTVFWDDTTRALHCVDPGANSEALATACGLALQSTHVHPDAAPLLAALKSHLHRVSRRHRQMPSRPVAPPTVLGCLPTLFDTAVIALDQSGRVLEVTVAATDILRNGGLQIKDATLSACTHSEDLSLRDLLQSIPAPGPGIRLAGATQFTRDPLPPLRTVIATLPETSAGKPVTLVFLCDPSRRATSRAKLLRAFYRLSPTELRLVDELICGCRLKDAAIALRLTENTARFHLKEVFRKMAVNTQVDLLRAVLAMPGMSDLSEEAAQEARDARSAQLSADPSTSRSCLRIASPILRSIRRPPMPSLKSPGERRLMRVLASL